MKYTCNLKNRNITPPWLAGVGITPGITFCSSTSSPSWKLKAFSFVESRLPYFQYFNRNPVTHGLCILRTRKVMELNVLSEGMGFGGGGGNVHWPWKKDRRSWTGEIVKSFNTNFVRFSINKITKSCAQHKTFPVELLISPTHAIKIIEARISNSTV